MKAFVQVNKQREFDTENQYLAWRSFKHFGYEVTTFTRDEVPNLEVSRETPCFGGIATIYDIFEMLGVKHKELESYPECLRPFFGRNIEVLPLREAIKKGKVFLKPLDESRKVFNGMVYDPDHPHVTLGPLLYYFPQMPVYVSEVTEFYSEFRVFIHEGKILDGRPYKGDPAHGWSRVGVEEMIEAFPNAPRAYCLDVGFSEKCSYKPLLKKQVLVETTDAFSFGHYGLDMTRYGRMLIDRWEEITKI